MQKELREIEDLLNKSKKIKIPFKKHKSQLPKIDGISNVYGLVSQYWLTISLLTPLSYKGNLG